LSRGGGGGGGRSSPICRPCIQPEKNQAERKKSLAVRRSWQGVTSVKQEFRPYYKTN